MIKVISDFSMLKPVSTLASLSTYAFSNVFGRTHRFIMSNGKVSTENDLIWTFGSTIAYKLSHNAFMVTGNVSASSENTSKAGLRLYGFTSSGGFPREGIYQFGVRLKRTGTIPNASPFNYFVDGESVYRPTASTASTDVYVELVVDFVNSLVVLFYDGTEVWRLPSGVPLSTIIDYELGSMYYTASPNPFMSGGKTELTFSDFYCANYSTKPISGYPIFGSVTVINTGFTTDVSGLQTAMNSTYDTATEQAPTGYEIGSGGVDFGNGGFTAISGSVVAVAATASACKTAASPATALKIAIKESGVEKVSVVGDSLVNPTSTDPVRGQPMAVYCKEDGSPMTGIDLSTISVNLTPTKPRA